MQCVVVFGIAATSRTKVMCWLYAQVLLTLCTQPESFVLDTFGSRDQLNLTANIQ
jgi:hypothetical protein